VSAREAFLKDAQSFVSRHLDQHQSAATTCELEIAALLIMVDVSMVRGLDAHNREILSVLRRYCDRRQEPDSGACSVALARLATIHTERIGGE
jgi:hypothetical protein